MRITELKLKSGSSAGAQPLSLPLEPSITVFVGPNNSGKSAVLREIAGYCSAGDPTGYVVLERLLFEAVDEATAERDLELLSPALAAGESVRPGFRRVRGLADHADINVGHYLQARTNPNAHPSMYAGFYAKHLVRRLEGGTRLTLVNAHNLGDLTHPSGLLTHLLVDDPRRALVRERIYSQLGLYLALDIMRTPQIQVRLSPESPPNERTFEESTRAYMKRALPISAFSDGVQAFCGMMIHIHVGSSKVIVIDEPEAFLAPPLAHALGKELATGAMTENKQVFAATHSSDFLMGAITAGAKVNIIRLTYDGVGSGTARLLPAADLTKLMNDPMLRSANVLSSLFYRGAVVGEADADRAFYQECNERMLSAGAPRALKDVLFLNANGKDVVPMIIEPLRRLGIPAASIVDLDVVKKGGLVWTRHMQACGVPGPDHQPFGTRRANAVTALDAADQNWKRNGGIEVLSGNNKDAAEALVDELERYGMFILRRGEIEAWLSSLSVSRSKQTWLREIFLKMGSDPEDPDYVKPAASDVWEFLGRVATWIADPNRRGMQ